VKAARVELTDGSEHIFENDPADDRWQADPSPISEHCADLQSENKFKPAFLSDLWTGVHLHDCNYQKFAYFLQAALVYGLTTETHSVPNPDAKTDKTAPKTMLKVDLCYDPGIAEQYDRRPIPGTACGKKVHGLKPSYPAPLKRLIPVMRSPYDVYQYFGHLLATNTARRVVLIDADTPRLPTNDRSILTVHKNEGDCFAWAQVEGDMYCVPRSGAANTKTIFVLLNTLVNLSTTRSSLPVTQTFIAAP